MKQIIDQFPHKHILVLGDFMIDRYIYGSVERVSPEAPTVIFDYSHEKDVLGGAGNTAANLAALGVNVSISGVTGEGLDRTSLIQLLCGMQVDGLVADKGRCTTVKTRFVTNETKQQAFRFDKESKIPVAGDVEQRVIQELQRIVPSVDAIVISDYAKGVFTEQVSRTVRTLANEYKKPIVADIKPKHMQLVQGVYVIKPNRKEAYQMSSKLSIDDIAADIAHQCDANVVLTLGGDGVLIYEKSGVTRRIAARAMQVFDVTGAGDTVNAVLVLALASGASLYDAAFIANAAASVVVQKPGTATLTREELLAALDY